jgi:uncharacterized protein (TIGR00369 family)
MHVASPFEPWTALVSRREGHIVALGLSLVSHGENWCELALGYDRRLVSDATSGILASGPIVSLMDTAGGLAVLARIGAGRMSATLDLRLDYLRPARPGMQVNARAECYRITRRVAFMRGIAHDGDPEDPIAHATGTYMLDSGA